jgi:hypothetical protein
LGKRRLCVFLFFFFFHLVYLIKFLGQQ